MFLSVAEGLGRTSGGEGSYDDDKEKEKGNIKNDKTTRMNRRVIRVEACVFRLPIAVKINLLLELGANPQVKTLHYTGRSKRVVSCQDDEKTRMNNTKCSV